MTPETPSLLLVRDPESEPWTIEIEGFADFRQKLGSDVVNAFARCFIHADRLTSLIGFAYLSEESYGGDSRPFARDLQTVVWFVVGTLRELATAIRDLRAALAKRKLLDPNSSPWKTLREVEKRWEDDPFFRKMRDIVAFHVDAKVIEKGLQALDNQHRVVIVEGEGEPQRNASLKLGLEALFMGSDMDTKDFERFISAVGKDQGVSSDIQQAFILALEAVDIPLINRGGY